MRFPDDPEQAVRDRRPAFCARASLEKVLASRARRCDGGSEIRRPPSRRARAEGSEERYWSPVNSPVVSDAGEDALDCPIASRTCTEPRPDEGPALSTARECTCRSREDDLRAVIETTP